MHGGELGGYQDRCQQQQQHSIQYAAGEQGVAAPVRMSVFSTALHAS